MLKYKYLKDSFGYASFRPGQEALVDGITSGRDALGVMPTGGGKSLCYQLPAIMMSGTAIVISPLISLMKDQVDSLNEAGIEATYINSSLDPYEISVRMDGLRHGDYKLVYMAPERLGAYDFIDSLQNLDISLVAVDEAHCISQWGHDFRPSYREIPRFLNQLRPRPPVAAYTATATPKVIEEIMQILELSRPVVQITGFDRPNLFYQVTAPGNKFRFLDAYLREKDSEESGIIYCSTRKNVESVTAKLREQGYSAAGYHGGMDSQVRKQVQEDFMYDRTKLIVATNAFGMGIDKSDVRFVVHYNMPQNMEAYYQEAGRAGRDGMDAECILMYSASDVVNQKMLIENNQNSADRRQILNENLQYLINYCHSDDCLRYMITDYFGEDKAQNQDLGGCGNCGNCRDTSEKKNVTVEAQKIMSCIYRTNQRFGMNMIIRVLRGSSDKRLLQFGLDKQSTYGIMKDQGPGEIREIIMMLIAGGYLQMTTDTYPVLKLDAASRPVLKGQHEVYIKVERLNNTKKKDKAKKRKKLNTSSLKNFEYDDGLYEVLSTLRAEIASQKGLPSYTVFHNAALMEMSALFPLEEEAFLKISGVGQKKLENYGAQFIDAIQTYIEEKRYSSEAVEHKRKSAQAQIYAEADSGAEGEEDPKARSTSGGDSMEERVAKTYKAYQMGESLETIAKSRGFTTGTIIKHLIRAQESGEPVDWSVFIDAEHRDAIIEAVSAQGLESLKSIKDSLPDHVTYDAIRAGIELFKQTAQK